VYGVIRHGARYPTGTKVLPNLEKLLALAKDINSSAPAPEQCETDLQVVLRISIFVNHLCIVFGGLKAKCRQLVFFSSEIDKV